MTTASIIRQRLFNQGLLTRPFSTVQEVTEALGPVQGQDYYGTKWSLGMRCNRRDDEVEQAINEGKIVRTWPMRGTLHFVSPKDVRWILSLIGPYVIRQHATMSKAYGLDEKTYLKCFKILDRILAGGACLTRDEISENLNREGIATGTLRLSFIFYRAGMEKQVCFGPRKGKQFTYTLLDSWVPESYEVYDTDRALYELARRYFTTRGPATLRDFVWWSSLPKAVATRALEIVLPEITGETHKGITYYGPGVNASPAKSPGSFLLPGFDEYLLAYADRSAVIPQSYLKVVNQGNAMFMSTVVIKGKVRGSWKRTVQKDRIQMEAKPIDKFTSSEKEIVEKEARRLSRFLKLPVEIAFR
jgi:hypothetical protein